VKGNYTVQDVLGILWAAPFFIPVLLAPGYLVGLAWNVLGFRARGASERILLSLTLSCAISPFVINILCRFFSVRAVAIVFLLIGIAFLAAVLTEWKRAGYRFRSVTHWTTRAALCMAALWGLICLVSLPDLQLGQRLYSTAATYDHAVRCAFISSALRTGAPPANPFFYPGHLVNARYYYYWNVLCAIPAYLSGANARVVLYASCLWSGLCLASIIPVYLKHFLERQARLRLTTLIAFALLAITGLDLIPTFLISLFHTVPPYGDMEWWDIVQVASWLDSLLWVPHHVASLVASLAGFLLLWKAVAADRLPPRIVLVLLSAMAFSSAAGLSVYVTFTFALFVMTWVAYLLVRGRFIAALLHAATGLLAVLMSSGYLADLMGHGTTQGAGTNSFVEFSLRELPVLFAPFTSVLGMGNGFAEAGVYFLLLILTLFLELGIYFAVGVFQLRHDWKKRDELPESQKCLWFMASATLVVMVFLRSTVIGSNDLAWRGSLVLQFVLLLWTAVFLTDRVIPRIERDDGVPARWRGRMNVSTAFTVLILIGGASSLYQLFMLRTHTFFSDRYQWQKVALMSTGPETYFIREAYARLDRTTPVNSIAQYNPESKLTIQLEIYSRYQVADGFAPGCATVFGGSLEDCRIPEAGIKRIFNPVRGDVLTGADVAQVCRSLKVDLLLVNARDPVWNNPDSWVWKTKPSIQNDFVRIYQCGSGL
jgi:hypothetical protein